MFTKQAQPLFQQDQFSKVKKHHTAFISQKKGNRKESLPPPEVGTDTESDQKKIRECPFTKLKPPQKLNQVSSLTVYIYLVAISKSFFYCSLFHRFLKAVITHSTCRVMIFVSCGSTMSVKKALKM